MVDDIIIGKPTGAKPNSAIKIFGLSPDDNHGVSHNSQSYWISRCILDLDCIIYKNTKEGKVITKMIADKKSLKQIQKKIDHYILQRVSPTKIYTAIQEATEKAYKQGQKDKCIEINKVLNPHIY